MTKEFIKQLSLTTVIILFLYICGSLYLIGFWGTFDFDISNIVGVIEIPKSFLFPFVVSNSIMLTIMTINVVAMELRKEKVVWSTDPTLKLSRWRQVFTFSFTLDILILITLPVAFNLYYSHTYKIYYWVFGGYILSMLIAIKFAEIRWVKLLVPYPALRSYICILAVYTPIMCFVLGKSKGVNIYANTDIRYITSRTSITSIEIQPNKDTTSLKLLGFLGEKIIVSTLDNKKIYVLNQSAFNVVEIENRVDSTKKKPITY